MAGILAMTFLIGGLSLYRSMIPGPAKVHWDTKLTGTPLVVETIEKTFVRLGYDFDQVKNGAAGVPRILVCTVPDDLGQVPEVERRKALFFGAVLPVILAVNEQLTAEREIVDGLAKKIRFKETLNFIERADLQRLAIDYEIIADGDSEGESDLSDTAVTDELLLRVAPVPVSLALAQAAEEGAWGLSRFAAEGNALYGQWVFNDEEGIVPKGRRKGQGHSVQAFDDIFESTVSYAHNLNTHRAYERFRHMRANMLNATGQIDGSSLAGTLTRYSGRGQAYVDSLRSIIRANELPALDRARFTDRGEFAVPIKS